MKAVVRLIGGGRGMLLAVRWLVLVQIVVVTSREIGISPMVPDIFNSMIASLTEVGSECVVLEALPVNILAPIV